MNVHTTACLDNDKRVSVTLTIDGGAEELRRVLVSLTSGRESPEYNEVMTRLILVLARVAVDQP